MKIQINKELRKHAGKLLIGILVVAAIVWLVYSQREKFDWDAILDFIRGLPVGWFIAAFFILPLAGFPISILLLLTGVRFGFLPGMALATGGVFFHNYIAYHLTHGLFRERVKRYLERFGHEIPSVEEKHRIWFTAAFAAVHGPPYVAKLYLLALTDIPFRIYFWFGAPVYILFCIIPVGAGSAVAQFDAKWLYLLISIAILSVFAWLWLRKRK